MSRKRRKKAIRDSTVVGLTYNDYNLLVDRMDKVGDETCQNIDNRHSDLFEGVTNLLQTLYKFMKEVRVTVSNRTT